MAISRQVRSCALVNSKGRDFLKESVSLFIVISFGAVLASRAARAGAGGRRGALQGGH